MKNSGLATAASLGFDMICGLNALSQNVRQWGPMDCLPSSREYGV